MCEGTQQTCLLSSNITLVSLQWILSAVSVIAVCLLSTQLSANPDNGDLLYSSLSCSFGHGNLVVNVGRQYVM